LRVGAKRCADAAHFVCRNRHTRRRPAHHDTARGAARGNGFTDRAPDARPWLRGILDRAEDEQLVATLAQGIADGIGQHRTIVGSYCDTHLQELAPPHPATPRPWTEVSNLT
jgi:hypothetical protein